MLVTACNAATEMRVFVMVAIAHIALLAVYASDYDTLCISINNSRYT